MTAESNEENTLQTDNAAFRYGVFTKNRVEAFSDGIFAIIVTLLILEIQVPHIEHMNSSMALLHSLQALLPKFVSWIISFLTICIVWVNHHRIFDSFKGFNIALFWLNVQVLLWVCFIPFPTALIGDYPHNPLAVAFYGIVMALTGAALVAVRFYGANNKDILKDGIPIKAYKKAIVFAFIFGPVFYLAGAALAWINTLLSFAVYFLIAVYFIFSFKYHGHQQKS
ncbi:MAG: TMEM175 family protein [Candidatus Omnitrophota bacterium]